MKIFFKKYYHWFIFTAVMIFVSVFCLQTLTTKPHLWFDEGLNIEAAHNFLLFQKLNIQIAPEIFSDAPFTLVTSGYPLTLSLAAFFNFFGFGFWQARLLMLGFLLLAIAIFFLLTKKFFGRNEAIITMLLVAGFAPFYANGLTAMGDIPGMVFLLVGLYFLIKKENFILTGLFFGLAIACKASLFLPLLPAIFIYLLIKRQNFFLRILKFVIGILPPFLLHAMFVVPQAFTSTAGWLAAIKCYQNPFVGNYSLIGNIINNLKNSFLEPTVLYFAILIFFIIWAFLKNKNVAEDQKNLFIFFCFYGFLVFAYFLRSPGWLRYLLPLQLLSFIFILPAFQLLAKKINRWPRLVGPAIVSAGLLLVIFQGTNLLFGSSLPSSNNSQEIISFLKTLPKENIAFINLPQVAAFIDPEVKFQVIQDIKQFGENPLAQPDSQLMKFLVFKGEESLANEKRDILESKYKIIKQVGSYKVFERI